MKVSKDPAIAEDEKILSESVDLHKNLAIGFAQAMNEEGVSSDELKKRLQKKYEKIR